MHIETALHLNSYTAPNSLSRVFTELWSTQALLEDWLSITSQSLLYPKLKPVQQEEYKDNNLNADVLRYLSHNIPLAMHQQQLPRQKKMLFATSVEHYVLYLFKHLFMDLIL